MLYDLPAVLPERHDGRVVEAVDGVRVPGQLVVLVQVGVQAHSLPEQGVGVLPPAHAVACGEDGGLAGVAVRLEPLVPALGSVVDLLGGNPENLLGQVGVGICARPEGVEQRPVVRHVGENAGLHLRGVAGHEGESLGRPDGPAQGEQGWVALRQVLHLQPVGLALVARRVAGGVGLERLQHHGHGPAVGEGEEALGAGRLHGAVVLQPGAHEQRHPLVGVGLHRPEVEVGLGERRLPHLVLFRRRVLVPGQLQRLELGLRLLLGELHGRLASENLEHLAEGGLAPHRLEEGRVVGEAEELPEILPRLGRLRLELLPVGEEHVPVELQHGLAGHAGSYLDELQGVRRHVRQHGLGVCQALGGVLRGVEGEGRLLVLREVHRPPLAVGDHRARQLLAVAEAGGHGLVAGRPDAGDAAPRRHRYGINGVGGMDAVDLVENQEVEPGSVVGYRHDVRRLQPLEHLGNIVPKRHASPILRLQRQHLHGEAGVPDVLDGTHLGEGVAIFC